LYNVVHIVHVKHAFLSGLNENYSGKKFDAKHINFLNVFHLGRVVRKPVNANPGLKVNWGNNVSGIKVLTIAYVLFSLRLLMLKTGGQKM